MNFFCTVLSVYFCFFGCSNGLYLKPLSNIEGKNRENPSENVDTSRVLMHDESQTFIDKFLEALHFKHKSRSPDCSDTVPAAAASETKEMNVTDEDWLTTMMKDLDKLITTLGEDGDLSSSLGLEEGPDQTGPAADYQVHSLKEAGEKMRFARELTNLKNKHNSRGHKMTISLGNRPRSKRDALGTNKAGLVFIPNQGKNKKGTNRAGVMPFKTKRESMQLKNSYAPQKIMKNSKIEVIRRLRNVKSSVGTNKAGLVFIPKQDKSKAGSNRVEKIVDKVLNNNQNVLPRLLNKRNIMKKLEPQFSLTHRRQITVETDDPNLIRAIEKEVAATNGNKVQTINGQNKETSLIKKSESNHNGVINSENHAPSVPFLSSSNSETSNSGKESTLSNLSSKVPGIPNIPSGITDSGNAPTAVIGGFSMILMPMPGMSLSTIQNMFQTGQQFSQLLPALPSLTS